MSSNMNPIILSDIETVSEDETIFEDEYSELLNEQVFHFFYCNKGKFISCKSIM